MWFRYHAERRRRSINGRHTIARHATDPPFRRQHVSDRLGDRLDPG